ncbi:hypothetical protein WOLCODRAFT_110923 [Wolfiporia cocos MD-104 SS10]|uniref:MULE transposase domain-containing protein n=1 Tax=Wolfiporia cocos (strain MD-104) TaxID=742152 RepID=A0A2H3JDE2_WOLCO|nr:hypothetical protein WOLCODRAFT_110923 [Wolfiporia cocos MD-104 SS10]
MARFSCDGWLHITVPRHSHEMLVSMKHTVKHIGYVNIDLPQQWKSYIRAHARTQTPGEAFQIWRHILRTELAGQMASEVNLPFRSKAVYYYWHVVSKESWKLADDPVESVQKFIQENGDECNIALLDVQAEPNTQVVAFQVTNFVREWASNTQELAMDSTWNTNGTNFELFGAVADVHGSGIPLAFLLISTSKKADRGAKQAVLERFLSELRNLGVNPEYTLLDKDWSEINAMRSTWPQAKHQLCFWHGLRAIKQRLVKNKETPAFYDVDEARREFSYINANFVPYLQQTGSKVCFVSALLSGTHFSLIYILLATCPS